MQKHAPSLGSSGLSSAPFPASQNSDGGSVAIWTDVGIGWLVTSLALLALKSPMLNDPYFWDELGCYFAQVYQMSTRLSAYLAAKPEYVRSPLLTSLLSLLHHFFGPSRVLQHGAMVLICSLVPPSAYALTRQLGGTKKIAFLAALLCFVTPAFFAQSAMVQMDLPATGICTIAFVCLLRKNLLGFALAGSMAVLIKESTYYVCLPAALVVYGRLVLLDRRKPLALSTILRLWPTAIPGITLFLWLLVHRRLTGAMISGDHTAVIGLHGIFPSLLHNFVEGRRFALSLCALAYLFAMRMPLGSEQKIRVIATAVLWMALPFCFPGHLVRYLLPSLPALCVLAALGVSLLPIPRRAGLATLLVFVLVSGFRGDSFHENPPFELEGNLSYRLLLQEQVAVVRRVAASGSKLVIADFPFANMFPAPREFGYLENWIPTLPLHRMTKPDDLCQGDVVVMTSVSQDKEPLIESALRVGILVPWFVGAGDNFRVGNSLFVPSFARHDLRIRVYRVTCPPK